MELEEAGEKWRAGDAAKSMRFFMRAIANYDDGLIRHPDAFDLAYNKYVFTFQRKTLFHLVFNYQACIDYRDYQSASAICHHSTPQTSRPAPSPTSRDLASCSAITPRRLGARPG